MITKPKGTYDVLPLESTYVDLFWQYGLLGEPLIYTPDDNS